MTAASVGWIGVSACVAWVLVALRVRLGERTLPRLSDAAPLDDASMPALTIVVAACNEEDAVERAAATLLALDHPALDVVFVDDRSTDRTNERLSRIVRDDPRATLVRVDALPAGWLGKVHALARGLERATGDWVLFTDADVEMAPDTLRRALSHCRTHGLDHLTLFPRTRTTGLALGSFVHAYAAFVLTAFGSLLPGGVMRRWQLGGVGAFNLFRRDALPDGALEWLRMEVQDDVGLSLALRNAGATRGLAWGGAHVALAWYGSVAEMVAGLRKVLFPALAGYSVLAALLTSSGLAWLAIGPLALFAANDTHALVAGLGTWAAGVGGTAASLARLEGGRARSYLAVPLGLVLLGYALAESVRHVVSTRGLEWRGTHYPIDDLRRGQRVKLGA